ncbi:DUF1203 domain-containing protein [Microlunatus speluncae]|uniref:DUF1203 domain-containing protein n=1 Tax=Microlunatus speluncae TaxID=2594267 RepID=UPI001266455A|nr:DUF1203 domain-containing protein [Microlunatus speluncae]
MDIFASDTTDTPLFRLHPIPPEVITSARTTGVDVAGHPIVRQTAAGREPLRCCLRNAQAGEELILFGYRPVLPVSPYLETGAVFTHAEPCAGPPASGSYPSDWIGRPQVLRAYDERGWIHPASTHHDGSDPAAAIAAVLAQPGVVQLHLRNVAYGCLNAVATPVD